MPYTNHCTNWDFDEEGQTEMYIYYLNFICIILQLNRPIVSYREAIEMLGGCNPMVRIE